VRVAFLGPQGTFSEEALMRSAAGRDAEAVPQPTIFDCVMAVQEGATDRALVPLENSLEGSVDATIDALVFEAADVAIVGELVHPIRHCLIAAAEIELDRIERVLSHPQASAQCRRFLRERLSQAEVVPADSTADAVRIVALEDRPWAALGPRIAAELYGGRVLLDGVEDRPDNETRFALLARTEHSDLAQSPPGGRWKTSIAFWGLADTPGSLVAALQEFAGRGVNLSRIESRPRRQGLGRYIFFADLQGHVSEPPIDAALGALRQKAETVRVLGCYPAAA
jgi:prephenate dehydratase